MIEFLDSASLNSYAILCITLLILITYSLVSKPSHKVLLLDFACYKPPINQAATKEMVVNIIKGYSDWSEETTQFLQKIIQTSGLGESTYLPVSHLKDPVDISLEGATTEAETVIFGVVDEVLAKTKVKCEDIGILVVNSTVFNTTPSLSSMVVNRYKLRDNIASYNLSGMGCAAGLLAITLAKQLLQVHKNTYALVVNTETITQNAYWGNDLSKTLVNSTFRVGGAAILLSNRPSDHRSSKYQLIHTVRNNTSSTDLLYRSIFLEEDQEGYLGITITRDLLTAAMKAIKTNLTSLDSLELSTSERVCYIVTRIAMYLKIVKSKPLNPEFKKSFDHILSHVGGKPVLDALQRTLKLPEVYMEPSRMTLYRFGNTSSSSIWYELAYVEAKQRMKKGDRVRQMAYGSGFKCCSVVWRAIRDIDREEMNPWSDEIDNFPVDLSAIKWESTFFNKPE